MSNQLQEVDWDAIGNGNEVAFDDAFEQNARDAQGQVQADAQRQAQAERLRDDEQPPVQSNPTRLLPARVKSKTKRLTAIQKEAKKTKESNEKKKADKARVAKLAEDARTQSELERVLLQRVRDVVKKPRTAKKARDRYVAMNPAQQQFVNFLSRPHSLEDMPSIWRAQLCILPIGVQESVPEPDKYFVVKIRGIRPKVLKWSETDEPYLHLSINDKDFKLDLTFKRCVLGSWVDSDKPFFALNRALTANDADLFSEAQQQFAQFGVVLIPRFAPSNKARRSSPDLRRARPDEVGPVRTSAKPNKIARIWRDGPQAAWPAASDDVRPGVFENMGNSCYFHSAMLMLYKTKDWYSDQVEFAEKSSVDGGRSEMLSMLDELLKNMESHSQLPTSLTMPAYDSVQRVLFPLDLNRQQDANEFFVGVLNTMERLNYNIDAFKFPVTEQRFDPDPAHLQEIDSLVHNARLVPRRLVESFKRKWATLSEADRNLDNWTLVKKNGSPEIVRRTVRDRDSDGYQPPLQRANLDDPDPTGVKITDGYETRNSQETVLKVYLPPGRGDVCRLIETAFNEGQYVAVGFGYGLFNVKTLIRYTYTYPPGKYLVVSMLFNPDHVPDAFEYCESISLNYERVRRAFYLHCVIFRFGCTADAGHYTAALKVDDQWVYYDDSPPSRKLATLDELSAIKGVPFMLLFRRE